jgi:ATP-dependent Clp protease, protease subunit
MIKLDGIGTSGKYMILTNIDPKIKPRKAEELVELPKIILVNKFDEEAARIFREQFASAINTGQSIIPIVIDSYGGQVYALMSMIATIKASPVPVATIGTGKMMSCGSVLLSCGTEKHRYVDPLATCMIHDVSSMAWGKVEEIKADAKEAERLNELLFTMMAENCSKPKDYFMKLIDENKHADLYLSAEECKKHNLINHIRVPSFNVKINANISFE